MNTVLIVDDEKNTREGLRMALDDHFEVYIAADLSGAKSVLSSTPTDVLVTDLRLGGESGMDLIEYTQKQKKSPISIMMTAYGDVETAVEAMRRGAWHFVTKPLNLEEIEVLVRRAGKLALAQNKIADTTNSTQQDSNPPTNLSLPKQPKPLTPLNSILGKSSAISTLKNQIKQVAPTRATLLIEGESGTGKELVAQATHLLSPRAKQALVTVHCAALSDQLLESELFGHEKGAFTGATQQRKGRFELAHNGTLFLDEIGEISLSTQVKLLRALGERSIERVGSATSIEVDTRVIAATNKDLWQMVQEGTFREDLYYRLAVVRLETPPLRQRASDIPLLAQQFLQEFCLENNFEEKQLSEAVISRLIQHTWPGNVRELRTVIEHAVVMSQTAVIEETALPSSMFVQLSTPPVRSSPLQPTSTSAQISKTTDFPPSENNSASSNSSASFSQFDLRQQERRLIEEALASTAGNRTQAAKLLGISRRTLQRKLDEQP